MSRPGSIWINQAYADQRITGQQRYASEIAERLQHDPAFRGSRPAGPWARSTAMVWAWVQAVLPVLARGRVVLSMTARAPIWARRHVLVVHDLFAIEHPEWFSRRYYWTHAPLLKAQIRTAAAVLAVSQPVADQLRRMGRDDVVVAPNAPSEVFGERDETPSSVLGAHGVAPGTALVAVGSRDPRKNLAGLAQAYGLLSEEERRAHPLVLVGGGSSIYRDEDLAWPEGTIEAGYVDDDELRRLYRDAGTVVFVSLAEGFGLPLVEAARARARSLTVSDIEVFRWVCGDGARYVDPHSAESVAAGLRAELAEPTSPLIPADRFTWERSAETVARVCRDVGSAA